MENDKKVILKSKGSNSAYIMNDNLLFVSPLKVPKGSVCESWADFSDQFRKIIVRYKRIGYNINVMRQSACLVFNPITVNTLLPSLIARRWVGRQTQWWPRLKVIYFSWFGPELFVCCLAHRGSTFGFLLLQCSSGVVRHPRDLQVSVATRFCRVLIFASSLYLSVIYLFHVIIHWWVRKPPRGPNNCMFWAMIEAEGEVGRP